MIGYEYGNTRLRAMRSRLLGAADYSDLVVVDNLDRLLGALHRTDYREDVESAVARERGLRSIDEAIRRNLSRAFRSMRSFYEEEPGELVGWLVRRWDVRNLQSILRARSHPAATPDVASTIVPAGELSSAELSELADQRGLRETIDLMVAWEIPSRPAARRVLRSWPEYERTGDVAILERALHRSWGEAVAARLDALADEGGLGRILRAEIDLSNVLTALRYRQSGLDGAAPATDFSEELVAGGRITELILEASALAAERGDAAAAIVAAAVLPGWTGALMSWVEHGSTAQLSEELSAALATAAVGLFASDPLTVSVPTAFTFAKETEARNLRLISRGVIHGLPPDEIAAHLVMAA